MNSRSEVSIAALDQVAEVGADDELGDRAERAERRSEAHVVEHQRSVAARREPVLMPELSERAANLLVDALARRGADESPRQALLRLLPYQGLQETIRFDGVDGAGRKAHFSVVRGGRFEPLP